MTAVYWLEQTESDVAVEDDWLHGAEAQRLGELRFAKRRADWRLGRWTAKRAVAGFLKLPRERHTLAAIEIRAAASGAPEVFLPTGTGPSVSLSHSAGRALCVVTSDAPAIGCDLEKIEPRSDAFVDDYFTAAERAVIPPSFGAQRDLTVALLWSAKESVLKVLHEGLRLDTRSVTVIPFGAISESVDWQPFEARSADGQTFHGWWRSANGFVRTSIASPPSDRPVELES